MAISVHTPVRKFFILVKINWLISDTKIEVEENGENTIKV